jgi:hypothetical protein
MLAELEALPRLIADAAEPLPDIDDGTFGEFFGRFGDARVVLLGEASHGTSEFYRVRAAISRHLIERHGFNIVAVEADWPDAATIDRYVRHRPKRDGEIRAFERFPTWMWRNAEVALQSQRVDARGDRFPRRAGCRARTAGEPPLWLSRPLGREPGSLRSPFAR